MRFKIHLDGTEKGPFTLEQIQLGVKAGAYPPDIGVRPAKGGGEYLPLSEWLEETGKTAEEAGASSDKSAEDKTEPGTDRPGTPPIKSSFDRPKGPGRMKMPNGKGLPPRGTNGKGLPARAGKIPVRKKTSFKERILVFVASVLFATIILLVFLILWQRTGVELTFEDSEYTVFWEEEEWEDTEGGILLRRLRPDTYSLRVEGDAYHLPFEESFPVTFARLFQRHVELERGLGSIRITSNRTGARYILVNEEGETFATGTVPELLRDVPAGPYTLTFQLTGWEDQVHQLEILPERSQALRDRATERMTGQADSEEGMAVDEEGIQVADVDFDSAPLEIREEFRGANLVLESTPNGARFQIETDGEPTREGVTPGRLEELRPGNYSITFSKEGWEPVTVHRNLRDASTLTVRHEFPHGRLRVLTEPRAARVYFGGEFIGRTPLQISEVPHGDVEVRVSFVGEGSILLTGRLRSDELLIGARFVDGEWEPFPEGELGIGLWNGSED